MSRRGMGPGLGNRFQGASASNGKANAYPGDSICLTATGTLTPGNALQISGSMLGAGFLRQPIEIRQINILAVFDNAQTGGTADPNYSPTPAAYIRMSCRAGRYSMTYSPPVAGIGAGLVPIGVLAPRINNVAEYGLFPGSTSTSGPGSPASYCVWKFDRPMAMPLGTAPELTFQYAPVGAPSVQTGTMTIYVAILGRMLNEMPSRVHVPYASVWIPQSGVQDTSENDFRNMTGQMLKCSKIVARSYQLLTTTFGTSMQEIVRPYPLASALFTNTTDYSKAATLNIFDDLGNGWLRTPARFSALWPEDTLTLPFHYDLPASKKIEMSYGGTNLPTNTTWMPVYALLGSREESAW